MYPTHYWIQNPFGIRGIRSAWVPFGEGTLFETTALKGSNGHLCSESQSKTASYLDAAIWLKFTPST